MADPVRVLAISFVLACSSGSKPAQQPAPETTATATPPVITLGELTIRFDGNPIARLHADGRTESVGDNTPGPNATFTPGPTFHADGTIDLTKGGIKVRVESDGDIVVVPPPGGSQAEQVFGRISGNQIVTADSATTGIRLEGAQLVMFAADSTNAIGVIDPPGMGPTALLLAVAFVIDGAVAQRR